MKDETYEEEKARVLKETALMLYGDDKEENESE